MSQHCPSCLAFAGTFTKTNRCCQIRLLMESPKAVRTAKYEEVKKEEAASRLPPGTFATLKTAVHDEYKRKMEWKTNKAMSKSTK